MQKISLKLRVSRKYPSEYLASLFNDRLFAQGYFKNIAYTIYLFSYAINPHPTAYYCTLEFAIITDKIIDLKTQEQFIRIVSNPFLDWVHFEANNLSKPQTISKIITYTNDKIILDLIQDKNYRINLDGSIEHKVEGQWIKKPMWLEDGRYYLKYKRKNLNVSRIIYAKFNESINSRLTVSSKDGDQLNNHKDNIIQLTLGECAKLSYQMGRKAVKGNAKLTEAEVLRLKQLKSEGYSYSSILTICKKEQIKIKSKGHLSGIFNGKNWSDVALNIV